MDLDESNQVYLGDCIYERVQFDLMLFLYMYSCIL